MTMVIYIIEKLMASFNMRTAPLAFVIVVKITLAILNAPPLKLTLRAD